LKYFFGIVPNVLKIINLPTSKMNALDCPICMDVIDIKKNCVTTECGHCFHASCLMANVAHNGFDCPYCRSAMAEEPEDDDETEATMAYEDEEYVDEELYDDYALRGLRFMTNNLEGVDHDILDIHDEREDEEQEQEQEQDVDDKPTSAFITSKLIQEGVTMEQLVKCLLLNHQEYEDDDRLDAIDNDIFGKMRIIISNYRPEEDQEEDQPAPPVPRPVEPISAPLPPPIAEAKTPNTFNVTRHDMSLVA